MILDPIRAAVQRLYDTAPPPVTVYGVRFSDGDIEWCADRDDAIDLRDGCDEPGAHLVTVTGHVRHHTDDTHHTHRTPRSHHA